MNKKPFWGYNTKEGAESAFGKEYLENPNNTITESIIDIVDDDTKWPQTSSTQCKLRRIETDKHIISYSIVKIIDKV